MSRPFPTQNIDWKAPKTVARLVVGFLLLANLVAAYFMLYPAGGGPEDLEAERVTLQSQIGIKEREISRLRLLAGKTAQAQDQGDQFLDRYFLDRRTASSTLVEEIVRTANQAGIKPKEHSIAEEAIEGSQSLSSRTITGNYEGTYGDLIEMVNAIERSPRFLVVESLSAAPQANGGLIFQVRYRAFVKENDGV
jgi:Tfp pilus assembly protein PilO